MDLKQNSTNSEEVLAGTEIPEVGGEGGGGDGTGGLFLTLHFHHQTDSCIQMGSDESHFNASLTSCEGQSHKTVSTDHNFSRERRAEAESNRGPSAYQPNAVPLGHTGPRSLYTAQWSRCAVYAVGVVSLSVVYNAPGA